MWVAYAAMATPATAPLLRLLPPFEDDDDAATVGLLVVAVFAPVGDKKTDPVCCEFAGSVLLAPLSPPSSTLLGGDPKFGDGRTTPGDSVGCCTLFVPAMTVLSVAAVA